MDFSSSSPSARTFGRMRRPSRQFSRLSSASGNPCGLSLALLLLGSLLLVSASATAQAAPPATAPSQPDSSPVAGPDASVAKGPLMTMPFFVLAKNEQPISNLTKNDVTVGQDGHPEIIQSMSSAADQPLSLAILVDTRASQAAMVKTAPASIKRFLDTAMSRPADQAAVIDFNDDAGLDLALSNSKDKIQKALDHLSARPVATASAAGDDRNIGGNVLFDALFLASDEVLKPQGGRKVIVVLTDGLDRGSKENILSSIEAAQRAHALIYTIGFPAKEKNQPQQDNAQQDRYPQGGGGGYGK